MHSSMADAFYLCGHVQCDCADDEFGLNGKMVPLQQNNKYPKSLNISFIGICHSKMLNMHVIWLTTKLKINHVIQPDLLG